jgi:hypothetical protein
MFRLILGYGSDQHPFILSMSSKALLSVLLTASTCLLPSALTASTCLLPSAFHMDSTFKCNENEFPVTLLGVSDAQRQLL